MLTTSAIKPFGSWTDGVGGDYMLGLGDDSSYYYYHEGEYSRGTDLYEDTLSSGMPRFNYLMKNAVFDSIAHLVELGFSGYYEHYAALEFDFVPKYDSIAFQIVFLGIGNWPRYACSSAEIDIFSAIISGPSYPSPYNIARVPGTDVPITINTINGFPLHTTAEDYATDDEYYIFRKDFCTDYDLEAPFSEYYVDNVNIDHNPYSGHTTVLTLRTSVNPCDTYRIQIAGSKNASHNAVAFIVPLEGFVSYGSGGASDCSTSDTSMQVPSFVHDPSFCMIYPNPMEESIQIRLQGSAALSQRYQVRITDALGKTHYERQGSLLSINRDLLHIGKDLLSGIYFLHVSDLDQYKQQDFKFVKQ